jgi:hypothetical protein
MAENGDWLRVRGIGRERFATYVADFLTNAGYAVERSDSTEPSESRILARLNRQSPAVPQSAREVAFRIYPTSGGAALVWTTPTQVEASDSARMDRFVREFASHVERAVLTESHATAKVSRVPDSRLPWIAPQ